MNPPNLQQSPNPLSNPYISPLTNPGNPQQNSQANNQPNQNQTPQQSAPLQAIMQSLATRQQATDPRFASQVNPNPPSPSNSIQNPGINGIAGQQNNAGNQVTAMPSIQPMQLQPPPQNASSQNPLINALNQLLGGNNSTQGQIGKATATSNYAGYCLQWVDDQQGNKNRQPTAYADYQANQAAGNIQTQGIPPAGARVYFAPNSTNGNMGHVGISDGGGSFTSATDNGIQTFNINDWDQYAGQQYIGFSTAKS